MRSLLRNGQVPAQWARVRQLLRRQKSKTMGFVLVGAFLLLLLLLSFALHGEARLILLRENGLVESATALLYFACAAFIAYRGKAAYLKRHPDLFLLVIFFLFRELDFDKKFTAVGLFKGRFFESASVTTIEKAIGAAIMLVLVAVVLSILFRYSKGFFLGLLHRSSVSIGALISIGLLGISQLLDGLPKKLRWLGIDKASDVVVHASALEEILELGIPMILLLSFAAYFRNLHLATSTQRDKPAAAATARAT
jgi:hypothetical protein